MAAALAAAATPREFLLKEKDHENLGKKIGAYYTAVAEKEGIASAKADVGEAIAKLNKKLSKKSDVDLLGLHDDLSAAFTASISYSGRPKTGKVFDVEEEVRGMALAYSMHLPKSYKANKGALPLIICIPDEGEDKGRHLDEEWNHPGLRGSVIMASLQMPEDVETWTERTGGLGAVMFGIRHMRDNYAIDPDRIFLAGRGAGVAAAGEIAAMFPFTFAGVIGRSGELGDTSPKNFRNLPCYFSGGGSKVTEFTDGAKDLGYENMTVDPGGNLDDLETWVTSTVRDANPSSITFAPTTPFGDCYWLRADGFDPEESPELTATIDREKNVIAITSKGISTANLWFNDALVDLSREVTVICNGVEHKDTFKRNLTIALDRYFLSNDASRIYTAAKGYDLPDAGTD